MDESRIEMERRRTNWFASHGSVMLIDVWPVSVPAQRVNSIQESSGLFPVNNAHESRIFLPTFIILSRESAEQITHAGGLVKTRQRYEYWAKYGAFGKRLACRSRIEAKHPSSGDIEPLRNSASSPK
jgi:hypothetical protein